MNLSKLPWRYRVISMLAAVAFMLSLLWPFVTPLFKEFSTRELGPMLASTVYQPPGAEPVMVRVMQSGNSRNPVYEILFNDLLSSKLLVQPQRIDSGRQGPLPGAALQRFTDGSIFLIISGDQLGVVSENGKNRTLSVRCCRAPAVQRRRRTRHRPPS